MVMSVNNRYYNHWIRLLHTLLLISLVFLYWSLTDTAVQLFRWVFRWSVIVVSTTSDKHTPQPHIKTKQTDLLLYILSSWLSLPV